MDNKTCCTRQQSFVFQMWVGGWRVRENESTLGNDTSVDNRSNVSVSLRRFRTQQDGHIDTVNQIPQIA